MKKTLFICLILLSAAFRICAQTKPAIPEIDRVRIAEAFRVGEKLQDKLWTNWHVAPFAMDFITDDHEFLIRHPKPPKDFQSIGYDKKLKSEVFVRSRKFQKNFLATFPAFDQTPVIIVGKAENTLVKTSTPWIFTVLHEHFHQLQMSQPAYFADVEGLNISRGDKTGMWQLNFLFPYSKKEVAEKFKALSELLVKTYDTADKTEQAKNLNEYLAERRKFAEILSADEYKYFSFQIWQEGAARYTQYKINRLAADKIKPGKEFKALKDFTPFDREAENLLALTMRELKNINLTESERVVFYPFGAVEGLLLDKINPNWRDRYFAEKFGLEKFLTF